MSRLTFAASMAAGTSAFFFFLRRAATASASFLKAVYFWTWTILAGFCVELMRNALARRKPAASRSSSAPSFSLKNASRSAAPLKALAPAVTRLRVFMRLGNSVALCQKKGRRPATRCSAPLRG